MDASEGSFSVYAASSHMKFGATSSGTSFVGDTPKKSGTTMSGTLGSAMSLSVGTVGRLTVGASGIALSLMTGASPGFVGCVTVGLSVNEDAGTTDVNVGAPAKGGSVTGSPLF